MAHRRSYMTKSVTLSCCFYCLVSHCLIYVHILLSLCPSHLESLHCIQIHPDNQHWQWTRGKQVTNLEWNADKTSRNSFESYVLSGASRNFLEIIETGLLEEIQTSQAKWNQKEQLSFLYYSLEFSFPVPLKSAIFSPHLPPSFGFNVKKPWLVRDHTR